MGRLRRVRCGLGNRSRGGARALWLQSRDGPPSIPPGWKPAPAGGCVGRRNRAWRSSCRCVPIESDCRLARGPRARTRAIRGALRGVSRRVGPRGRARRTRAAGAARRPRRDSGAAGVSRRCHLVPHPARHRRDAGIPGCPHRRGGLAPRRFRPRTAEALIAQRAFAGVQQLVSPAVPIAAIRPAAASAESSRRTRRRAWARRYRSPARARSRPPAA